MEPVVCRAGIEKQEQIRRIEVPTPITLRTCNALINAQRQVLDSSAEYCMAVSEVVMVGDEIANSLISRMGEAMQSLKIGTYTDAKTTHEVTCCPLWLDPTLYSGSERVIWHIKSPSFAFHLVQNKQQDTAILELLSPDFKAS